MSKDIEKKVKHLKFIESYLLQNFYQNYLICHKLEDQYSSLFLQNYLILNLLHFLLWKITICKLCLDQIIQFVLVLLILLSISLN